MELIAAEQLMNDREMQEGSVGEVPEDSSKLIALPLAYCRSSTDLIVKSLTKDLVVLVRGATQEDADDIISSVSDRLGLRDALELQAGFAASLGHREKISRYYMSVNKLRDYQYIPPHSEGHRFSNMQIASLYCYENSTDGGENILWHINDESEMWGLVREQARKVVLESDELSATAIAQARELHKVNIPDDVLSSDDEIIRECESTIPGMKVYDVLVPMQRVYSCVLGRKVYPYWDMASSPDIDSGKEYFRILRESGMLKEPPGGANIEEVDGSGPRRLWRSGVKYSELFTCRLTRKLEPGDLIIQNNLTWAHSRNNWTPGSGHRKVVAAFA